MMRHMMIYLRNKEVIAAAVETKDRKRKQECDREEMKMDMQEPCNKKQKIDAAPAPEPVQVLGLGRNWRVLMENWMR